MRIAIFGGSFNPPHLGHLRAAQAAVQSLRADKLFVIPSSTPPHKQQAQGSPGPQERFELTRLAFEELDMACVLDLELRRGGISYTVDTLEQLRLEYPNDELFLLMGGDMLLCFDTAWKDFERILKMATLSAFSRQNGQDAELAEKCRELKDKYGVGMELISFVPTEIASTQLRDLLKNREGVEFFPEKVYAEIIRKRYYEAKPNLAWLRERSLEHVEEKRHAHVLGCEQEAVSLAKKWNCDADKAAEAAILHDITKQQKGPEQLKLCDTYGIITDNGERDNYKLLHSKTGAELSRRLFGIDDDVYGAILRHTTGAPEMSLLEKVIYLADYIEPNRDFEGLEKLRTLAYEDLDMAMRLGLEMSLEDLSKNGKSPHKNSLDALKYYTNITN